MIRYRNKSTALTVSREFVLRFRFSFPPGKKNNQNNQSARRPKALDKTHTNQPKFNGNQSVLIRIQQNFDRSRPAAQLIAGLDTLVAAFQSTNA